MPSCVFGPKAKIQNDNNRTCTISLENQDLLWSAQPENILIIKRIGKETDSEFIALASWLITEKKCNVFIEPQLLEAKSGLRELHSNLRARLKPFVYKCDQEQTKCSIDLIVTLGGDGTLLYAASLFQSSMPPVVAFNLGSLGFLAAHSFSNFKQTIESVLRGKAKLMLRSRLFCKVEK